jgi:hypothetical protein
MEYPFRIQSCNTLLANVFNTRYSHINVGENSHGCTLRLAPRGKLLSNGCRNWRRLETIPSVKFQGTIVLPKFVFLRKGGKATRSWWLSLTRLGILKSRRHYRRAPVIACRRLAWHSSQPSTKCQYMRERVGCLRNSENLQQTVCFERPPLNANYYIVVKTVQHARS